MKSCNCPSFTTASSCTGPKRDGDVCRFEVPKAEQPSEALVALLEVVEWWKELPATLRQDIEGSGAEPGVIARAKRLTAPPAPPEEEKGPDHIDNLPVHGKVRRIAEALHRASPERIDAVVEAVQKLEHRAGLKMRYLTEDEIVEDIVLEIKKAGDEATQGWKAAKFDELIGLHHTVGQSIRNQFGLWQEDNPNTLINPEPNKEGIIDHHLFPDQVSHRIIERVWVVIQALPAPPITGPATWNGKPRH